MNWDSRSTGGGRQQQEDDPCCVTVFQRDERTLLEADELRVGFAGQQDAGQLGEVRKVPDQHQVVGCFGEPMHPCRRVIVGGESVALLGVDVDEPPPNLCRLTGTRRCRSG